MKLASFIVDGRPSYGVVDPEARTVTDLGAAWGRLPTLRDAIAAEAFAQPPEAATAHSFDAIVFDLPIPNPGKVALVGKNYADHVAEGADATLPTRPGLFFRALNTLVPHLGPILKPINSDGSLDFEGELAVIVGRRGRCVPKHEALRHVFGYTCFNDGSERRFQYDLQVIVGKNFASTGGFGPWIATADEIPDPSKLTLVSRVNGTEMQRSGTDKMIFDVPTVLSYISDFNPLEPGDVISTGTPQGVGRARNPPVWLKPGDTVEVEISGIGTLRNPVEAEA